MKAISLFSSGGIGDLALKQNGIDILLCNELLEERCDVLKFNYPESEIICGNIWEKQEEIIEKTIEYLKGEKLDILYATPPCQGMSKNGRGTILKNIRDGVRPKIDERNRLIIPAMNIAKRLNPETIILENVPEMANTVIETAEGEFKLIVDYIKETLGQNYYGKASVVEFADYGVPQRRQRLITIFTRNDNAKTFFKKNMSLLPPPTHSGSQEKDKQPWITLRDAIYNVPQLDAKSKALATSKLPFHRVPVLDEKKYWWVSSTPKNKSAFDNQCSNCGYNLNKTHGSAHNSDGINRANTTTSIKCEKCDSILPRPSVIENGEIRIMKGFTSAYKRMNWNLPANALTTNLSYACSDSKLHPEQNRVLSLYEAFIIHTVNEYSYEWMTTSGKPPSDKVIREIIGESIPPKGLSIIVNHLLKIISGEIKSISKSQPHLLPL